MSAVTPTAGYPPHAVVKYHVQTNGAPYIRWRGACGAVGVDPPKSSSGRLFGKAGDARRKELCPKCFPNLNHKTYHPDPVEVPTREEV